jgi:hypothetical protein
MCTILSTGTTHVAASTPRKARKPERAAVLSKAVVRASEALELRQAQLGKLLGLSPATASRLNAGTWRVAEHSKPWELATAFVRIYRSLSAITGGDVESMRAWMHSRNTVLGGVPAERILQTEGLIHVLSYLDAERGRI